MERSLSIGSLAVLDFSPIYEPSFPALFTSRVLSVGPMIYLDPRPWFSSTDHPSVTDAVEATREMYGQWIAFDVS